MRPGYYFALSPALAHASGFHAGHKRIQQPVRACSSCSLASPGIYLLPAPRFLFTRLGGLTLTASAPALPCVCLHCPSCMQAALAASAAANHSRRRRRSSSSSCSTECLSRRSTVSSCDGSSCIEDSKVDLSGEATCTLLAMLGQHPQTCRRSACGTCACAAAALLV